jgi:nitronate monooxygenase
MSGNCPPSLAIAVGNAGGLGACGALLMKPDEIKSWAAETRAGTDAPFQINLWIPDPTPTRDQNHEREVRDFLAQWGPDVAPEAGDSAPPPNFEEQCQAVLEVAPKVASSIMGLYPPAFVAQLKAKKILWFATATTVAEAKAAADAGADAIIAQGFEAGGHRGSFESKNAENQLVGLVALIPQIADAVNIPVIAAGGITDGRAVAAALVLGASAVQVGTGFLRAPEAHTAPSYADRLAHTEANETAVTRAFSGRLGRAAVTKYLTAAHAPNAPRPAPYPVQRGLTKPMREAALKAADPEKIQMWAGQSAKLALASPASSICERLWHDALQLLP